MPKMTSKGQVTIPKKVRDHLALKPGSEVQFENLGDGRVVLKGALELEERVLREEERIEKALAALSGGEFEMITDEVMRLTRGWGEPDYERSLRASAPASADPKEHRAVIRHKVRFRADKV